MQSDSQATEDFLEHYGTKGMKWGKTSAGTSAGSSAGGAVGKSAKKKVTSSDIKGARKRQADDWHKLVLLDNNVRASMTTKGKNAALKAVEKHANEMSTRQDDARIASKLTRGEKVAATLVLGPIGLALIGGNAIATRERKS